MWKLTSGVFLAPAPRSVRSWRLRDSSFQGTALRSYHSWSIFNLKNSAFIQKFLDFRDLPWFPLPASEFRLWERLQLLNETREFCELSARSYCSPRVWTELGSILDHQTKKIPGRSQHRAPNISTPNPFRAIPSVADSFTRLREEQRRPCQVAKIKKKSVQKRNLKKKITSGQDR
jgi:hypothetical protein